LDKWNFNQQHDFFVGAILVYTSDPTHSADCIKNCYRDNDVIIAKLNEPLSEKEKTFNAEASGREIFGKKINKM
jgi:hypothetical protein